MPTQPQDPATPPAVDALRVALADLVAAEARTRGAQPGGQGAREATRAALADELAERLRTVCRAAHDGGLPPERVIVLLKEIWTRDTDSRLSMRSNDVRLAALVSACIESYYADGEGRPPG